MKKFTITMAAAALMLGGCGGSSEGGGEGSAGGEQVASYEGAVTSTDVAGGEQVYADLCAGCHHDGTGGAGAAPAVHGISWTPAQMRHQIREGERRMPAFNTTVLPAEQLEALMAYLVSTGGVSE